MVFLEMNRFVWALWPDTSQNPTENHMENSGCIPLCWSKGACIYAQHPLPSMYFLKECYYRQIYVLWYISPLQGGINYTSIKSVCSLQNLVVNYLYKSRPADVCIYANFVRLDEFEFSFSAS